MKINLSVRKSVLLLVFVTFVTLIVCGEDESNEEFVPTHEWQKIKEDQAIPPGLHIKMDLENGGKWAKLNDEVSTHKSHGIMAVNNNVNPPSPPQKHLNEREELALKYWEETLKEYYPETEDKSFSYSEIKEALKNIKTPKEDKTLKTTRKFKPIEEIKEELRSLNINLKTDYEVMLNLQSIYRNPLTSDEEKLNALRDLEFYVHQVDNAMDFVKIGGLNDVVLALNHSSSSFRQEAALVIGSAVQSNPKVQIATIELGALSQLCGMLSDKKEDFQTRKSALFAISSLIRQFPIAQTFFAKLGGFNIIMQLFNENDNNILKLQMKALRLLTDIMRERNQLSNEDAQYNERLKQYDLLPMTSLVEDMHLCEELMKLLDVDGHDRTQTVLEALNQFRNSCSDELKENSQKLKTLQKKYKVLATEEMDDADDYFVIMGTLLNDLIINKKISDEL